ncbi:MAG TPA: UDP-N-acetylmuramoyl-L-alanine--D-glutamate ligase [Candidatus Moranbacteria bacterium]|nr:UDP-N-acetylmuramoyl-L-alanine--D-glutamate ligase [Candidatus Moranbacteria bacterium]HRZ33652.1 UDP-N-acetylmuramoyl-L-alanine--D-glutamate ligase [Candidatus Moranbacteria bacterium]
MDASFFKDKKITVMGIGLHGGSVGMIKFLSDHGAKVIATDIKTKEHLESSLEKLKGVKNVHFILGHHRNEDFTKVDMVIKNPAVPWNEKHIKIALENNIPVEMDSGLFFKLCKNKIIGVTGSKGKTTTSKIIYDILKSAGKNPIKVGIGQISVMDRLEKLEKDSIPVFELSSWRLSALGREKVSPHIAVITNIFIDHLNYYKTMEKYIEDKQYIFSNQNTKDWLIINGDDQQIHEMVKENKSQIISFSYSPIKYSPSVFIEDNIIFLNDGVDIKRIISTEKINILGKHNLSNVMAAIGAVYAYGISVPEIKKALPKLKGTEHRLEFVLESNGIKYYNDTAATIPDAAILALESFSQPVILIAGGTDKNLDFKKFAKKIIEKTKYLVLLKGNATEKIINEINDISEKGLVDLFEVVNSMEEAVSIARKKAQKNDIVLLSPGAASFGLFANEFDRGDKFKEAVKK